MNSKDRSGRGKILIIFGSFFQIYLRRNHSVPFEHNQAKNMQTLSMLQRVLSTLHYLKVI